MLRGEELVYATSRARSLLLALAALIFVVLGAVMTQAGEAQAVLFGWLAILFFGVLGLPVLLWRGLRSSVALRVHRDRGIWLREGDASWVPWGAVWDVGIVRIQRQDIVAIRIDPQLHARRLAASGGAVRALHHVNAGLVGDHVLTVPSQLTIRPQSLARLLGELTARLR